MSYLDHLLSRFLRDSLFLPVLRGPNLVMRSRCLSLNTPGRICGGAPLLSHRRPGLKYSSVLGAEYAALRSRADVETS